MPRQVKREKRQNRYPEDLKRKIAKSYLAGEASYAVLAEENELKSKNVVKEFVRWYRKQLAQERENLSIMPTEKKIPSKEDASALEAKIKQLEKQLALSSLKVEALETLIDIAEDELKIAIRKKSGTKQSKK